MYTEKERVIKELYENAVAVFTLLVVLTEGLILFALIYILITEWPRS